MEIIKVDELGAMSGGINILTGANLFLSEQWGPVGIAFGIGWEIGTYLYNNYDSWSIEAAKYPYSAY
jgi:hypothetical protein